MSGSAVAKNETQKNASNLHVDRVDDTEFVLGASGFNARADDRKFVRRGVL